MPHETNTGLVVLRKIWVVFGPRRSHAHFQANSYMEPKISICEYTTTDQRELSLLWVVYLATARLASCIRFLAPYLVIPNIMITCNQNVSFKL